MNQESGTEPIVEMTPVKRALIELRELRAKLNAAERARTEPIAIVGMSCRFPGGIDDPDTFWALLRDGVDAVGEVPRDRWDIEEYFDPDPAAPGKMSTRWGGFIQGIDEFDPQFFGISPREAMAMDPQQRLLLELSWEALENAGHAPDALRGRAGGIFVGISSLDYVHLAMSAPEEALDGYLAQGIAHSAASGRLAYTLGMQGPALSVDTACSSSLMAIHLAVQSLRRGECELALAAGVNAILLPTFLIGFTKSQMMAADGRCKTFDSRADGFVRGEGCGVLVLKRLSDALADRDGIRAVIRGTAANQDGRSSGMTAPNGLAQEAVIEAALADAGVEPWQLGYVEAHGTGTALGDPIEVQALGAVMARGGSRERPLLLGSVKSNLGHTEAAAGVAGVIKTTLSLQHGEIPRILHFQEPNPFIPWTDIPVAVATESMPFPVIDGRRLAGVSSFGFSGTNVHVILEEAPANLSDNAGPARNGGAARASIGESRADSFRPERPLHLLKLSARTEGALDQMARRWSETLASTTEPFTDICYTANTGRADLAERLALVAASAREASEMLAADRRGEDVPGLLRGRAAGLGLRQVSFLFSGHGAQRPGMGRRLYETQPTFRAALDRCDALLRPYLEQSLLAVLFPEPGVAGESPLLSGMTYSQPALFVIEHALAELWRSWGIRPEMVLGHSVGEYAAAVTAGVFSLEDGLKLVSARGRLMDAVPERGSMLAVLTDEATVVSLVAPFRGRVAVAAINGPGEFVISGEWAAIEAVAAAAETRGIDNRRLAVAQAGHSHLLDPILDEFEAVAASVDFAEPRIGLVSCTTGRLVSAAEIGDPRYWRRHLRETVQFAGAMDTLHREGADVFLEIGPHPVLSGIGPLCLPEGAGTWLSSLRRDWDDWQQILESCAALYVEGVEVDWRGFERDFLEAAGAPRRRVPLPTYPWQHERYWLDHATRVSKATQPNGLEANWDSIIAAGRRQAAQGPLDLALHSFPERWRTLDRLTTAIVASTLRKLEAFPTPQEAISAEELVGRLGILPRYRWLFGRWTNRLADAGLLRRDGERYVADVPLDDGGLEAAWKRARDVLGDWPFMIDYLENCERLLPAVVTGGANAIETLYPNGSSDIADALYRDSVMPRYYHTLAGAIVSAYLETLGSGTVRALQVGATRGITATLRPLVEGPGGSYHVSELPDLVPTSAAENFDESRGSMAGPREAADGTDRQSNETVSYDLIIAANLAHAFDDVSGTLRRLRSMLVPGGLLLLVEVTSYLDWFDVSTALLDGWDRREDGLRSDHPILAATAWEEALRGAGFAEVAAFPGSGSPAEIMAQHVVLAQVPLAPGSVGRVAGDGAGSRAAGVLQSAKVEATRVATDPFAARVAAAANHEREDLLVDYVRGHVAALLRLEPSVRIERRARLMEFGLDSLMAVELRSRLGRGLPLEEPLPATLIFDYPTVEAIVGLLMERLEPTVPGADAASDRGRIIGPPADSTDVLEALTDEEVEERLLARLALMEEQAR
jgi:acyl transferase domain-containing protein